MVEAIRSADQASSQMISRICRSGWPLTRTGLIELARLTETMRFMGRSRKSAVMISAAAAVALILAGSLPQAAAQTPALTPLSIPQTYQDQTIQLNAWLSRPSGSGPFPAVILAHGCNGVDASVKTSAWPSLNKWAAWLNQQGYAALILDSYTARGIRTICRDQGVEIARELVRKFPPIRALSTSTKPRTFSPECRTSAPGNSPPSDFPRRSFSSPGCRYRQSARSGGQGCARRRSRHIHGVHRDVSGMRGIGAVHFQRSGAHLDRGRRSKSVPRSLPAARRAPPHRGRPGHVQALPGSHALVRLEKPDRKTKFGDTLRFSADATADARERIKAFLAQYLPKP